MTLLDVTDLPGTGERTCSGYWRRDGELVGFAAQLTTAGEGPRAVRLWTHGSGEDRSALEGEFWFVLTREVRRGLWARYAVEGTAEDVKEASS